MKYLEEAKTRAIMRAVSSGIAQVVFKSNGEFYIQDKFIFPGKKPIAVISKEGTKARIEWKESGKSELVETANNEHTRKTKKPNSSNSGDLQGKES